MEEQNYRRGGDASESTVDGGDLLSKGKRPGLEPGALLHMIRPYSRDGCLFFFCSMQHKATNVRT